jgi:hypothetical protein
MPRLLPPGFQGKTNAYRNISTHSTLQLTLLGEAVASTGYFFSSAKIVVDGITYQPHLRKTARMQTSLARAVDRVELQLQNLDDVLGIDLIQAREELYGAEVRFGRFRKDLESGAEAHKILFSGVVAGVNVNEQVVSITVISDAYAAVSVGADRRVARLCQFIFRDPRTCQYAGVEMVCNKMLNDAGGCEGRHGSPLKQAKYGGMAYVESAPTETTAAALTPAASNQVIQTDTDSFLQRPFTKLIGFTVTDNPTTKTTEISGGGTHNGWINVKEFGAVGDGVTNDLVACQAAITAANAGPRKVVYFPPGVYDISGGTLQPTGPVGIVGDGYLSAEIYSSSNHPIIEFMRDSLWRGGFLERITIRGNIAAGSSQNGVVCDASPFYYGGWIHHVWIRDCGNHGLVVLRAFSCDFYDIHFDNCVNYPFLHDAPNMPGNKFDMLYPGDLRPTGICGFRIKGGDFMGYNLNGINNINANSAWMVVGKKNGVDGDVTDASAAVWLQNCNIESSNKYGILLYGPSQLTCVGRTYFAMNTAAGSEAISNRFPIYYENNGDGVFYFAPLHPRGFLDEGVNFANGLSEYASGQAIHANGFALVEIDGLGPGTGGGLPLATYLDHTTGEVESLMRRDGKYARRLVTSDVTFTYPGVTYLEVDSAAGPITLTLPWSGWYERAQQPVVVKDIGYMLSTNPVTVMGGAGGKIEGNPAGHVMNVDGGSVMVVPDGRTTGDNWRIVAQWPSSGSGVGSGAGDVALYRDAGGTGVSDGPAYRIGTTQVQLGPVIWDTDGLSDIGLLGANRPNDAHLKRSVRVASPVAEDGSYDIDAWNGGAHRIPAAISTLDPNGTGPNPAVPALILAREGISGSTYASIIEFLVARYEHASTSARSELTIAATHGGNEIAGTPIVKFRSDKSANFQGEYGGPHGTGTGTGAQNITWADTNQVLFTLTGNVTFTFVGGKAGRTYTLITRQSAAGSNTITWPTIKWPGGAAGTITAAANAYDLWTFYFDGTNYFNIAKTQNLS